MKKTTSENLSKRLKQYSAFSAAIAGVANINAQVGYSGPIDVTITSGTPDYKYEMDMYGSDGIPEFILYVNSSFAWIGGFNSANPGSIVGSSATNGGLTFLYPYNLTSGQMINSTPGSWFSGGSYRTLNYRNSGGSCYGNWCNVPNEYVGLRFMVGADYHYGWARLSVVPSGPDYSITIHDFYYNPNPNEGIQAGQFAVLGVEESPFSKTKIIALHKTITISNLPESTDYSLYSLTGQTVLNGKTNQRTYTINGSTLSSGLYVVEVKDHYSGAILKKKVLL